jgi:hypothetical protein
LTQSGDSFASPLGTNDEQLPRIESASLKPRIPPGRAIRQINEALAAGTSPGGFLPAAENTLLVVSDDFTGKLGIEAISIARSRNASAVDAPDILEADRKIRGDANSEKRVWRLALAGFTGGAATAALIAVLLASKPVTHADVWWTCILFTMVAALVLFIASYPRHGLRIGKR